MRKTSLPMEKKMRGRSDSSHPITVRGCFNAAALLGSYAVMSAGAHSVPGPALIATRTGSMPAQRDSAKNGHQRMD